MQNLETVHIGSLTDIGGAAVIYSSYVFSVGKAIPHVYCASPTSCTNAPTYCSHSSATRLHRLGEKYDDWHPDCLRVSGVLWRVFRDLQSQRGADAE